LRQPIPRRPHKSCFCVSSMTRRCLQIRGYPPGERWPTLATVRTNPKFTPARHTSSFGDGISQTAMPRDSKAGSAAATVSARSYRRVAVMREHDLQAKRHRWTGMNCRGYCQRTEIHRMTPHFLQVVPAGMPWDQAITQLKVSSAVALPSRWLSREREWSLALEPRQDHRFAIGFTQRAGNTSATCRTGRPWPSLRRRRLQSGAGARARGDRFARTLCRPLPYHRNGRLGRRLLLLVEVAHLTFDDKSGGKIGFGVSRDFLDVRYHAISKGNASERVASQWT
jgi:hypothetical protein